MLALLIAPTCQGSMVVKWLASMPHSNRAVFQSAGFCTGVEKQKMSFQLIKKQQIITFHFFTNYLIIPALQIQIVFANQYLLFLIVRFRVDKD